MLLLKSYTEKVINVNPIMRDEIDKRRREILVNIDKIYLKKGEKIDKLNE